MLKLPNINRLPSPRRYLGYEILEVVNGINKGNRTNITFSSTETPSDDKAFVWDIMDIAI